MSRERRLLALEQYISAYYSPPEYPTLAWQSKEWEATRPLSGLRLLEATPVYRNTLTKYIPLISAGAELEVSLAPGVIYDPAIPAILQELGISTTTTPRSRPRYDIILDCAGVHSDMQPSLGCVELTRSGYYKYKDKAFPVFLADEGKIKTIETTLGTGEGFLRALKHLGYTDLSKKKILLFGFGKVGQGIALYTHRAGAEITVIDPSELSPSPSASSYTTARPGSRVVDFLPFHSTDQLAALLIDKLPDIDILITATGIRLALDPILSSLPVNSLTQLLHSHTLLANMGVEDEFGPLIPSSRVLNHKEPLNFILEEPTRLRFIETTMALSNMGAHDLSQHILPPELSYPTVNQENFLLNILQTQGLINPELQMAHLI